MFDYQQRETTSAYRDGWDVIWGKEEKDKLLDIFKEPIDNVTKSGGLDERTDNGQELAGRE